MNQRQHSGHRWLLVNVAILALAGSGLAAASGASSLMHLALAVDCSLMLVLCVPLFTQRGTDQVADDEREWSDRQLRLLASSPAIIYRTEASNGFRPTFVSPNVLEVIGYTAEQMLATPEFWLDHLHPDDRIGTLDQCNNLLRRGAVELEYRVRKDGGEYVWIRDQARLIRDQNGEPIEIIGSWSDISEQKRSELSLERARDEALRAATAKSEYLSNKGHEIRVPLNGVLSMLDLLANSQLNRSQHAVVETALRSGADLLKVIDGVLDSQIEADWLEVECADIDVNALIEDLALVFAEPARTKGLQFRLSVDAQLSYRVRSDPDRLRQVLNNLLSNAIKFSESGEIVLRLKKMYEDDSQVGLRFEVEDSGPGIDSDAQELLFSPFRPPEGSVRGSVRGSGLGLAICRELVELLGGDIGLTSRVGVGSSFWLTLDLPKGARIIEEYSEAGDAAAEREAEPPGGKWRVLVVEDNSINQKVAEELLQKLGVEVGLAANGREALAALARAGWDLVFMDWQMPVMDGLEATRAIREREQRQRLPRIPIIAMTANAMTGDRETCLNAGMDDYLRKPVKRGDLRNMLEKWLPGDVLLDSADPPPERDQKAGVDAIDRASVESLKELMGEDFAGLVESFVRESGIQLRKQQHGLRSHDMSQVRTAAHTLKSSAANMGAKSVSGLAREIEQAAQNGETVEIESLLPRLEAALVEVRTWLSAETDEQRANLGQTGAG